MCIRDSPEADPFRSYVSYELLISGVRTSGGTVIFSLPKYFDYPDPILCCRVEGEEIVVTAKAYAKSVEIQNEEEDLLLSDNYFDMEMCIRDSGIPDDVDLREGFQQYHAARLRQQFHT